MEKERVHEQLEIKRKRKHPLVRSFAHCNGAATAKAHGGGLGRSWRRTEELWRLGGLEKELGGALSSQGGGECYGVFNLAREGLGTVNLRERVIGVPWAWTENSGGVVHPGGQRGGGSEPGVSTSPGDAGKQAGCMPARAPMVLRARRRCWTGAGDPHRITVAGPYPLFTVLLQISAKARTKAKLPPK